VIISVLTAYSPSARHAVPCLISTLAIRFQSVSSVFISG
jgi:hypothetical protein